MKKNRQYDSALVDLYGQLEQVRDIACFPDAERAIKIVIQEMKKIDPHLYTHEMGSTLYFRIMEEQGLEEVYGYWVRKDRHK